MKTFTKKTGIIFLQLLAVVFYSSLSAQTTITLQPDGSEGKDAYLDSRLNDNCTGEDNIDFPSISWTHDGTHVDVRGLIEFDLSGIPENAVINSALLSLYSFDSPNNGTHSTLSGSNESVLQRVVTSWEENTVNWDNQPSATTENQVFLPASTEDIQDYLDINVTKLVQDMLNDMTNSHGFLLKLVTEEHYRRMVFASSDYEDANLHPKLVIQYTESTSISEKKEMELDVNIFPNPASHFITINLRNNQQDNISIDIVDAKGQLIKQVSKLNSDMLVDVSDLSRGGYFVKIYSNDSISLKKLLIE